MSRVKPFITIAIPSLNRLDSLRLVVQSVMKQTFDNYELLIIDDHSTEDIKGYIKSLKSKKIRFIQNTKSQGFKKMMIQVLLKARGKYIMTLGNDDIICDKNTLQNIYKKLKNKEVGLAKLGLIYYYKSFNTPCFSTQLDRKDKYIENFNYKAFFNAIDTYGLTHIAGTIYLSKLINKNSFLDNQLIPFFKAIVDCGTKKGFLFISEEYIAAGISTSYLSLFSQKNSFKELWFRVMYDTYIKYLKKSYAKEIIVKKIKEQIPFFIAIRNYVGIKEVIMLMREYINFESSFRYNIFMYISFIFSIIFPKNIFIFIRDLRYKVASKKFYPPEKYRQIL